MMPRSIPATTRLAEASEASAAHHGSILATMPDATVVSDDQGAIISFSSAAEQMFGVSESEVLGENVSILMASPDREQYDHYIRRYKDTGERKIGVGRVATARRHDGSIFPIELMIGETVTSNGRVFTSFIRDLSQSGKTERRLHDLQSELAHVREVSAIGTLATALAHELNQPLTAIANYVQAARDLVAEQDSPDQRLIDALEDAAAQSLRAGRIVRRLRDFIGRGNAARSVYSLQILVAEAHALALIEFGSSENLEMDIQIKLDPLVDMVFVDHAQILQVLINLLHNGLDALAQAPVKRLEIQSIPISGNQIEILVSDSGPGLSHNAANLLFEPFHDDRAKGMRLDFAMSRTVIEAQGGRIWATPSPLGGTVFHFTVSRAMPDFMPDHEASAAAGS